MRSIRAPIVAFLAGAVLASILLIVFSGSGRLAADLRATRWTLESSSRTVASLASRLQRLSFELNKSNGLALAQQQIIAEQQRQIVDQQRLVDGIITTINGGGKDIQGRIQAIADGFERLYKFYYPDDLGDRFKKP